MDKKRVPLSTRIVVDDATAFLPKTVTKALAVDFGMQINAYISAAVYGAGELYVEGAVFKDLERRFEDGDIIRTSIIIDCKEVQGYRIVQTLSSRYVICDWAVAAVLDGARSQH